MKSLTTFVFLACASACLAQTPLSLQQAVEQATRHRAEIASAARRVEAGEDLRRQSQAFPNPRLFLQTEDIRTSSNFDFAQDSETFGYLSQVIETSGARRARIELASADSRLSNLDLEQLRREIGFRVRDAYWQALSAQIAHSLYQESDSYFQQVVRIPRGSFSRRKACGGRPAPHSTAGPADSRRPFQRRTGGAESPARTRPRNGCFAHGSLDANRKIRPVGKPAAIG